MLKQILLETYQPEEKLLNFIDNIPNTKYKTSNGKSELIEKTNIKLISPEVIEIKHEKTKLEVWSYQNEEIINKSYYIPSLHRSFNFKNLKRAILSELSVEGAGIYWWYIN